ncbi:MAG: right-handed parallel beta-helix repeat-containing protein, partial [Phycisphaerales bacterium]
AVESLGNESLTVLRGFHITKGFVDFPDSGGGLYVEDSDATFVQCVFAGNRSAVMGGAVAIWGGSPSFVNCRFYGNDGGWAAGAIYIRKSATPTFVNCLLYSNQAWEGGAVAITTGAATFVNCTLSENAATAGKGGAFLDSRGEAALRNCIIWGNTANTNGTDEIFNLPAAQGSTAVTHSNVKGGWPGEGNLYSDPLFVDPATGDYRIRQTSPCKDKGQNASLPTDVADTSLDGNTTETLPKDLGLNARIHGDSVDMGAYEWHPEDN